MKALIAAAIMRILIEGIPSLGIGARPGHVLARDPAALEVLAESIAEAGAEYEIDPYLLVAIGFREGSFSPKSRGALDERGIYQMMPRTADIIARMEPRCTVDTIDGSTWCAAAWLAHWRDICGDVAGAIAVYATGKTCRPSTPRVEWIVRDRLRIAGELR